MLTLFWSISSGLSWNEAMLPLMHHGLGVLAMAFVAYMAIATFSILNIVTGVFVNSAISAATLELDRTAITNLKTFFENADEDGSGTLEFKEFEKSLRTSSALSECLRSLDIEAEHALMLFQLI